MENSDFPIDGRFKFIEAINGDHLHWSEFRNTVLEPFRIICSNSPKPEHIPSTFLARLQSSQKDTSKYDSQRHSWRLNVAANKGVGISPIFPPSLIPISPASGIISRCMLPKISREGLPLRNPSAKPSLYELPTAKSFFVCGFDLETFDESERFHIAGPLKVTGTVVDFDRGEVSTGKTVCCPFLTFEKFTRSTQQDIETARNHCAVIGAQNLRGQQQLFHKAFGLKTVSRPPITFTCAVNNEQSVINFHYVDDDGNYTMAALCKFNLHNDHHFNNFQAWVEAIESWASLDLLPRIKEALTQASRTSQTPPPSPVSSSSILSIDTNSDTVVIASLRRYWPEIAWRHEGVGETPINSSIAQCGTPMPTRNLYSQLLPRPSSNSSLASAGPTETKRRSSPRHPSPIQTDLALPQRISTPRTLSAVSSLSRDFFDGRSTSPASPCRPPSLSPSTPGPEAPISSKSPMLVMQRRLDNAMNEIQEMRGEIEEMQRTFNYKTERLERRLEMVLDSKQVTPIAVNFRQFSDTSSAQEVPLFIDEDEDEDEDEEDSDEHSALPGAFPEPDQAEVADLLRDMRSWYRIIVRAPDFMQWRFLLLICVWLCGIGVVDFGDLFANLVLTMLGSVPIEFHVDTSREEYPAKERILT